MKNLPSRLEICHSKPKGGIVLLCFLALTVVSFKYVLIGLFSGQAFAVGAGALSLVIWWLVLLPYGRRGWKAWHSKEPVVIIDADGITDVRETPDRIQWLDVSDISLGYGEKSHVLRFYLRSGRADDRPWLSRLHSLFSNMGDWNVNLWMLDASRDEVLNACKTFKTQAIRQQVDRLNKDV